MHLNVGRIIATLAMAILCVPLVADAQQPPNVPHIGVLFPAEAPSPEEPNIAAFRQSLNDLGYVDGQTVAMEYRYALGRIERIPDLVAERVRLQVDLLVIGSGPAAMAAKHITQAIPQRRQARRPAGGAAHEIRAGDQPQDGASLGPHAPANPPVPGR